MQVEKKISFLKNMVRVYNGGVDPNQGGGLLPFLGLVRPFLKQIGRGRRTKSVPTPFRHPKTKRKRVSKKSKGLAILESTPMKGMQSDWRKYRPKDKRSGDEKRAYLEWGIDNLASHIPRARKRRQPPAPVRGRQIIDPNRELNMVLKSLGLLTRIDGKHDSRHKFSGWFLHGPNAGEPRPGRRFHLTRQAFILAQLAFKAGNRNLPLLLTHLPKRAVKATALMESLAPPYRGRRRRTDRANQEGGMIGAAVLPGLIGAAKAGAILAPVLKTAGLGLLSGLGSVLGTKLARKVAD